MGVGGSDKRTWAALLLIVVGFIDERSTTGVLLRSLRHDSFNSQENRSDAVLLQLLHHQVAARVIERINSPLIGVGLTRRVH